jgi:hypothetical protein
MWNNGPICVPELDALNHFQCFIPWALNSACGTFSFVTPNPTVEHWFDNSAWDLSSNAYKEINLDTDDQTGRICYIR